MKQIQAIAAIIFLLGLPKAAEAQTADDTTQVVNKVLDIEFPDRIRKQNPYILLQKQTSAWDLDKKYIPYLQEIESKNNIKFDTAGLYMHLISSVPMEITHTLTEKNKLLVNTASKKHRAVNMIELSTPVLFHNHSFCLVEVKTENWKVAVLLQKIEGIWYKKSYAGGVLE